MSESVHNKLKRVRKPRVHITYDVESNGAVAKKELPFVMGVMGDYSGDNTKDKKAWVLIKESNCQNLQIGNARISEQHCNFFINNGKATAKELEDLINKVKETVYQKTKINLDLEIKIIGNEN